jgi:alpha-tubulin suppressor-like RCC1 family protein
MWFWTFISSNKSGCDYSWGENRFGQLGGGDNASKEIPTIIILNDIIFEKISCGYCHRLLLSRD